MLVSVIGSIYIGLCFMLIATGCYFLIRDGLIYVIGVLVIVLCFCGSLLVKSSIDRKFKRALSELARETYDHYADLIVNPTFVGSSFDDDATGVMSAYDFRDSEQK